MNSLHLQIGVLRFQGCCSPSACGQNQLAMAAINNNKKLMLMLMLMHDMMRKLRETKIEMGSLVEVDEYQMSSGTVEHDLEEGRDPARARGHFVGLMKLEERMKIEVEEGKREN